MLDETAWAILRGRQRAMALLLVGYVWRLHRLYYSIPPELRSLAPFAVIDVLCGLATIAAMALDDWGDTDKAMLANYFEQQEAASKN